MFQTETNVSFATKYRKRCLNPIKCENTVFPSHFASHKLQTYLGSQTGEIYSTIYFKPKNNSIKMLKCLYIINFSAKYIAR